jgi:hypothetical protein
MDFMTDILSTDDVNYQLYRPHGRVEIIVKGDIFHLCATGPFNEEIIAAVGSIESDIIAELMKNHGHWSEIIVFKKSCITTPETLEMLAEYLTGLKNKDIAQQKSAFVLPDDIEGSHMMASMYKSLYKKAEINMKVFNNTDEALTWLTK